MKLIASSVWVHYFTYVKSTILIIEDNEEVRDNTAELLTVNNYAVFTAENGKTGFDLARNIQPDLILCDMMMPDTDGQKFLDLAKQNKQIQTIPIIFFSAGTLAMHLQKKIISQSKGFLKKPYTEEDLLRIVEGALQA